MSKENRVDTANKFIKIISDHGRRFFEHKGEVGRFELKNGHIVWVCEYTKKHIHLSYQYWKFHHGGTMRHLINQLADFIRGKRELPLGCLGPWSETMCGGDLWGYGKDEMQIVRDKCTSLNDVGLQL